MMGARPTLSAAPPAWEICPQNVHEWADQPLPRPVPGHTSFTFHQGRARCFGLSVSAKRSLIPQ